MITLQITDTAKSTPSKGMIGVADANAEDGESFAALVARDEEAEAPVPDKADAPDEPADDETIKINMAADGEEVDVLIAPGALPDSKSSPGLRVGDVVTPARSPKTQSAAEGGAQPDTIPMPKDAKDVQVKPEEAVRKAADPTARKGLPTVQNAIEGQTKIAANGVSEPAAKVLAVLAEKLVAEQPKVTGTPVEARGPTPDTPVSHSGAVVTQAIAAKPNATRPIEWSDGAEKRKDVEARTPTAVTSTATATSATAAKTVQPATPHIAVQTALQAVANERRGQDGTAFDRELAIGTASLERPISATGQAIQSTSASTNETARSVVQQLTLAVAQGSGKTTEIALNPEELGRVRLTLSAADGALTLSVMAERPETQELLRRNIEMLAQEFRSLGYQDLAFSFGGEGQAAQSDTSGENSETRPNAIVDDDVPQETSKSLATSGLDLRL